MPTPDKIPPALANFLGGSKVGRDDPKNIQKLTIERDQLEKDQAAAELLPHLELAGKIYADFKWECRKFKRSRDEEIGLIDDAIIRVGLEVKHEGVRKQVIEKFQAMKEKLKTQL